MHAAHEGARFAYQLLYLLDLTPYYSPGFHLLGLTVARVSGGELAEGQREQAARRGARLAAARRPGSLSPLGLLREARLRLGYLVSDHTRSTLILSAFAFKASRGAPHPPRNYLSSLVGALGSVSSVFWTAFFVLSGGSRCVLHSASVVWLPPASCECQLRQQLKRPLPTPAQQLCAPSSPCAAAGVVVHLGGAEARGTAGSAAPAAAPRAQTRVGWGAAPG